MINYKYYILNMMKTKTIIKKELSIIKVEEEKVIENVDVFILNFKQ